MSFFKRGKVWTTRDGEQIPIRKLTDSHLLNIVCLLMRKTASYRRHLIDEGYHVLASMQGDMAQYCLENELNAMEQDELEGNVEDLLISIHPLGKDLLKEVERRGLMVKQK